MLDDLQWADFVEQCDTDQDGQVIECANILDIVE